jgi:hypothetical protein
MGSFSHRDHSYYGVAGNDILAVSISIKKELDTWDPHRSRIFESKQIEGFI